MIELFLDIFSYTFMQRAFLAGLIMGLVCPTIGVFLVLRRLSMIGETLSHIALPGVLLGFLFNLNPIFSALIFSLATALGLEKLRNYFKTYSEVALAVFTSIGLGLAVVLFNVVQSSDTSVQSLLFGSIVTITRQDLWAMGFLGFTVLIMVGKYYHQLVYLTFDEEGARLAGINVKLLNYLLLIATACIVAISMRIVGALLVAALLVLPVASSLAISKSFKSTVILANLISLVAIFSGLFLSYYYDLAPGGTIVLMLAAMLFLTLAGKKLTAHRRPFHAMIENEVQ